MVLTLKQVDQAAIVYIKAFIMNEKQQNESPPKESSQAESPKKKQKLEGRRIPETLVEPYDLVNLKQQKKKRFQFKKSESQEQTLNNAQLAKLKPLFGECFCSEQNISDQYTQTVYQLTSSLFVFSKVCSMRIRSINKIKLIGEVYDEETKIRPTILKVTWGDTAQESENLFVKLKTIEQAYFLFASIIMRKLLIQDFVLIDIKKKDLNSFETGVKKLEGQIYKISKFMRKWEKWPAKIDESLKIYKEQKINQQIKACKQIWTRFTMHNGFFVMKMFQGIEKIELGIPLSDYSNIESERNWLYLLSKLIK